MDPATLIKKLRNDLSRGLVVTVTGTGVSVTACKDQTVEGLQVSRWTGLLQHGVKHCRDIGTIDDEGASGLSSQLAQGDVDSLIAVAEQITLLLKKRSSGTYRGWLRETIGSLQPSSPEIIAALDQIPGTLATLNYDGLIEQVTGRRTVTWKDRERTQDLLRGEPPPGVLHLHGSWEDPDSVVLGFRSYQTVKDDLHTKAVLQLFTITRTLLFVGCGNTFSDPNFSSLLDWAALALEDTSPRHFLLCRLEEVPKLQQDLIKAPWLQILPYGEDYSDLVPFLKGLVEGTTVVGASSDREFEGTSQKARSSNPHVAQEFLEEFGAAKSEKLDSIRRKMREGHEAVAEGELRAMRAASSWDFLPPEVKGRTLRTLAVLIINRRNDTTEAASLLNEAKEIHPTGRYVIAEALLAQALHGAEEALPLLAEPANREEWHTRAVLFLNADKIEEARSLLESPSFEPDAETYRLLTHAYLLKDEIPNAKRSSDLALSLGAEQLQVRRTAAIVSYRSALSSSFENWTNWLWPFPPNWRYVRRDPQSRSSFQYAAAQFAEIAETEPPQSPHWFWAKTWQLACVANLPARHAEAQVIANEILSSDPGWVPAVAWALDRGLDFPSSRSREQLEKVCSATPDLDDVQALFSLLVSEGEFDLALTLIEQQRTVFDQNGLIDVWHVLQVQALLSKGDPARAESILSQLTGRHLIDARGAILRYRGDHDGWTLEMAGKLADEFEQTKSDISLFDACIAHHRAGASEFVAKHSEELMRRFGTEPALRLAIEATAAATDHNLCLRLMEDHRAVFEDGDFPPEVKRVRGICLRNLGRLVEAEQEFQLLVRDDPSLMDQFALFGLQIDIGQSAKAAVTAKEILHDPEAPSAMLLHIAGKLRPDNPYLAKIAFAQAMRRGLQSPQETALALSVGYPLGLDDELSDVMKEAIASVGTPDSPMTGLTLEELLEQSSEWRENRAAIEQDYRIGKIAAHAYSQRLGDPLVLYYHIAPAEIEETEAAPARRWSLRIRHGSKRKPRALSLTKPFGLFLDITSLLLAAHLDLLDKILEGFSGVEISPWVVPSLVSQIDNLTSGQPSRIPPKEEVVRLCDIHRIELLESGSLPASSDPAIQELLGHEWGKLFERAKATRAILIDHLPLRSNDLKMLPVTLEADALNHIRGCGDLLGCLEASGELTAAQLEVARKRLGEEGNIRTLPLDLDNDSSLILETGIAEHLALAGLLSCLASRARIFIRSDELKQLRLELAATRERERHVEWIRALKERIADSLETGRFKATPNSEALSKEAANLDSPTLKCLHHLLDDNRKKETLSCSDDRFISRFEKIGASPIVGIFDLLWLLHHRNQLSEEELFHALHRLRAGNVRYLPVSEREIVFHLKRARIVDGEIIEGAELAVIRRYLAACFLDSDSLQKMPPGHPEEAKMTETLFLSTAFQAANDALAAIWKEKEFNDEGRRAASDWILDALWLDIASIPTFSSQVSSHPNPKLFGMSESHLVFHSMMLHEQEKEFLRWLFHRWGLDPARAVGFRSHLKGQLKEMATKGRNEKLRKAGQSIAGRLVGNLPAVIGDALKLTSSEFKQIGLNKFDPVQLGEFTFDGRTLWPAARLAYKGKSIEIKAENPAGARFSLSYLKGQGTGALAFVPLKGKDRFKVTIPGVHALLNDSQEGRYQSMMKLRKRFDQSSKQAADRFRKISAVKRVDLRLREALDLLDHSVSGQIHGILGRIRSENQIDLSQAEPRGVASLLSHLRLPPTIAAGELAKLLDEGASTLVADEGFEEAFARCATLPVSMPSAVVVAFDKLGQEERQKFVSVLGLAETALLLKFQGALLLLRGDDADQAHGVDLLSKLFGPELADRWALLHALLIWTIERLRLREARDEIHETSLLAATWIHSARLHQLLSVGDKPGNLVRLFRGNTSTLGARIFDRDEEGSDDVSHPRSFHFLRFLISGISGVLADLCLGSSARTTLLALLEGACFSQDAPELPSFHLTKQRLGARNRLESFLAEIRIDERFAGDSATKFHAVSKEAVEAQVSEYLKLLGEDPSNTEAWVCLAAYVAAETTPEMYSVRLSDALLRLDFSSFANPTFEQLQLIAAFTFRQMGSSPKGTFEDCLAKLHQLANTLQDPAKNYPARESSHLLANCILWACDSAGGSATSAHSFANAMAETCNNHPAHADVLLKSMSRIAIQQPTAYHTGMWRGILEVRALARRMENFRLND